MRIKKEDIKDLIDTFEDLIEIKVIVRESSPNYELDDILQKRFLNSLKSMKNKLIPIFTNYLKISDSRGKKDNFDELRKKIISIFKEGNMAIISSNSIKKILKNIGIDPRQLIITGGPFFVEDYDKINPGIQKKCDRLIEEIKNIDWNNRDLYFLFEIQNKSDKLTLDKLDKISELIKKPVITIEINSWNEFKD
ncbi:MAG: DUF2100 domain-containing protein [Candidatus Lokiarchaeota archaeon]|nr:DUF2100 domain-containing protein [Candidatus Lokiarchaeota archaeon]